MRAPLALLLTLLAASAVAAQEIVDGIAAQVGSEIVLISDVQQVAEPTERRLLGQGASEKEIAILRAEVLERMIERALIRQVVRRAELDATEAEIDSAIESIAQENGLSVEQLKRSVEDQGLPFEGYRQRIREEIEHTKVVSGLIGSRVRIDEKDIRELYDHEYGHQPAGGEEVHLRHILVPFEGKDPAVRRRACEEVEQALQRIKSGEPFAEVATLVSTVNPENGGDIGWFHTGSLAAWMTNAVDSLPVGGTSEVIEMEFGCNLLHVDEKRPYQEVSYDNARGRLADFLYQRRLGEEYTKFIEELREQTYIERKGIFADAERLGEGGEAGAGPTDLGLGSPGF